MKIFVASSAEAACPGGPLENVCELLEGEGHTPLPWKEAFPLGKNQLDSLHDVAYSVDAAIFILTGDDKTWYRETLSTTPRDNLIFEYGLFSGHLGNGSAIALLSGASKPRMPSDLNGITWGNLDKPFVLTKRIREWLDSFSIKNTKYILHYPNKWSTPRSNKFWRDLSANASYRFGLVGRTNKSWIDKNRAESSRFADSICNLIINDGNVFIVSVDTEQKKHINFLRSLVIPRINLMDEHKRHLAKSRVVANFIYATYSDSKPITYRATLSDNKLILMPDMFDYIHRDNSLCLELLEERHESFGYYFDDIQRLVDRQSNGNHIVAEIAESINA